jgi:hypothetical protein
MKELIRQSVIAIGIASAFYASAMSQNCPYVDENGLPCMGAVFPAGAAPGRGQLYECSNGHRWVETN